MNAEYERARRAIVMGSGLSAMGVLHFVKPQPFDGLIPPWLPGKPRVWTIGSGVAESLCGGLLINRRTRQAGGFATAGLFAGVWIGNFQMAWDARGQSRVKLAVALARLPFQVLLIRAALKIARAE
ncbi:MAG: hypothetical protein ABI206_08535 [Antricoccus sp.]